MNEPGICPSCEGSRVLGALLNIGGRCVPHTMPCRTCRGTGEIDEARAAELNAAEERRRERMARGLSLREEAERLGMSAVELSKLEHP